MSTRRKKFELSPRLKLGVGRGHSGNILKFASIFCLILALGLAVNAFRLILANNKKIIDQATPQVLGASDVRTGSEGPTAQAPQLIEYKVKAGDTLFNVAQQYNISWSTLAALNNLKSPYTLKPGQTLKIPQ